MIVYLFSTCQLVLDYMQVKSPGIFILRFCLLCLFKSVVSNPSPQGPPYYMFDSFLCSNALDSLIERPLRVLQKPESRETCRMSDLREPGLDLAG